jgi:hypothetical protein
MGNIRIIIIITTNNDSFDTNTTIKDILAIHNFDIPFDKFIAKVSKTWYMKNWKIYQYFLYPNNTIINVFIWKLILLVLNHDDSNIVSTNYKDTYTPTGTEHNN